MNAEMAWLARDPARRTNPDSVLPCVKTIVSVGLSYHVADPSPEIWNDPSRGRVARYAWGRDYHDVMVPMLEELAAFIRSESQLGEDRTRAYVDTGALLEREIAERAGIGFIGKNTLVLSPEFGSTLLLGEVLVAEEIAFAHDPTPRGTCGSCTRCQTACPTHAFPAPYILDSRLCISYLTIENKGAIPEALRGKMGQWIFGCDDCQTVCPWVKQFRKPGRQRFLSFDPAFAAPKLSELLALDDAGFKARFAGTPLLRPKRRGLLRNVCVALGNGLGKLSVEERRAATTALEKAAQDAEPLIREHAAWALG
jgi:epoxyqueuosine reductase